MPNPDNITAPIGLVGAGRSGTSLLSQVFQRHPDFQFCGETVNLIFGTWHAVELSGPSIPPLLEEGAWVEDDERAARAVRDVFVRCLRSDEPRWFQKPIGNPIAFRMKFGEDYDRDAAGSWYWRVLRTCFPDARWFSVVRHPCDVVLSARSFWGQDEATSWFNLGVTASLLTHPDSLVEHVLQFEDLASDGARHLRELFDRFSIRWVDDVRAALDRVVVASPGREEKAAEDPSRRLEWEQLDPRALDDRDRAAIESLGEKIGRPVDWPAHFEARAPEPDDAPMDECERLKTVVAELNRQIHQLHFEFEQRQQDLQRRHQEDTANLRTGKEWLHEQWENWKAIAEERGRTVEELKKKLARRPIERLRSLFARPRDEA